MVEALAWSPDLHAFFPREARRLAAWLGVWLVRKQGLPRDGVASLIVKLGVLAVHVTPQELWAAEDAAGAQGSGTTDALAVELAKVLAVAPGGQLRVGEALQVPEVRLLVTRRRLALEAYVEGHAGGVFHLSPDRRTVHLARRH